jgi:hypothetical protein
MSFVRKPGEARAALPGRTTGKAIGADDSKPSCEWAGKKGAK